MINTIDTFFKHSYPQITSAPPFSNTTKVGILVPNPLTVAEDLDLSERIFCVHLWSTLEGLNRIEIQLRSSLNLNPDSVILKCDLINCLNSRGYLAYRNELEKLETDRDLRKGFEAFHEVLTLDPFNPFALKYMGLIAFRRREFQSSISLFSVILCQKIDDIDVYTYLAYSYINLDELDKAHLYTLKALTINPKNISLLELSSYINFKNKHVAEGLKDLKLIYQYQPASYKAVSNLAEYYMRENKCGFSYKLMKNLLPKYINSPEIHSFLGTISFKLGRFEEAYNFFKKALELNRGNYDLLVNLCSASYQMLDTSKFSESFEQLETKFPQSAAIPLFKAAKIITSIKKSRDSSRKIIKLFEKASKIDCKVEPLIYLIKARAYMNRKDYLGVIADTSIVLLIHHLDYECMKMRAFALEKTGHFNEALQQIHQYLMHINLDQLEDEPSVILTESIIEAFIQMAELEFLLVSRNSGINLLQKLITKMPSFSPLYEKLGFLNFNLKEYENAYDIFQKAFELNPSETSLIGMISSSIELENLDDAKSKLEILSKSFPLSKVRAALYRSLDKKKLEILIPQVSVTSPKGPPIEIPEPAVNPRLPTQPPVLLTNVMTSKEFPCSKEKTSHQGLDAQFNDKDVSINPLNSDSLPIKILPPTSLLTEKAISILEIKRVEIPAAQTSNEKNNHVHSTITPGRMSASEFESIEKLKQQIDLLEDFFKFLEIPITLSEVNKDNFFKRVLLIRLKNLFRTLTDKKHFIPTLNTAKEKFIELNHQLSYYQVLSYSKLLKFAKEILTSSLKTHIVQLNNTKSWKSTIPIDLNKIELFSVTEWLDFISLYDECAVLNLALDEFAILDNLWNNLSPKVKSYQSQIPMTESLEMSIEIINSCFATLKNRKMKAALDSNPNFNIFFEIHKNGIDPSKLLTASTNAIHRQRILLTLIEDTYTVSKSRLIDRLIEVQFDKFESMI